MKGFFQSDVKSTLSNYLYMLNCFFYSWICERRRSKANNNWKIRTNCWTSADCSVTQCRSCCYCHRKFSGLLCNFHCETGLHNRKRIFWWVHFLITCSKYHAFAHKNNPPTWKLFIGTHFDKKKKKHILHSRFCYLGFLITRVL